MYYIYYSDHREGSNHNMQLITKVSKSVTYENFSLEEAPSSITQQHIRPIAEDNVTIQNNPSYPTVVCSNPQVKPEAEDNASMEEDLYFKGAVRCYEAT